MKPLTNTIRTVLERKKSPQLQEVFEDVKVVMSYKQPPNLKNLLTKATFRTYNHLSLFIVKRMSPYGTEGHLLIAK